MWRRSRRRSCRIVGRSRSRPDHPPTTKRSFVRTTFYHVDEQKGPRDGVGPSISFRFRSYFLGYSIWAWAAANRAMGTRKGEQLT
jgi:hypothetical protein